MIVARKIAVLRKELKEIKKNGASIAFVPTMGALHAGHISLVKQAKKKVKFVVVSIFVNPAQFGKNEDFSKYPRKEKADLEMLRNAGADMVFMPDGKEIYPKSYSTQIEVGEIGKILCGHFRPVFFSGVATVVTKLFNMVQPDFAFFGEKDFQQLTIIKKLVRELNFPIQIIGVKTMREKSGLAMSSRNEYLTKAQKETAANLYKILNFVKAQIKAGSSPKKAAVLGAKKLMSAGFDKVDYIEYREAENLEHLSKYNKNGRVIAAAWLGTTRLIDNI